MKYVFVLPFTLLVGCGFATSPFDSGDDSEPTLTASDIARLLDGGHIEVDGAVNFGDSGGPLPDGGHIEGDEDAAHLEPDAAPAEDGGAPSPDATTPLQDAASPPPDASSDADAAPDADTGYRFTDHALCQECKASTNWSCGPQTVCNPTNGHCVPRQPEGGTCQDVCGGLFVLAVDFDPFVSKPIGGIGCTDNSGSGSTPCSRGVSTAACFD